MIQQLWAKSLDQAKLFYKSVNVVLQQAISGISVGGMKPFHLNDNECFEIAEACNINVSKNAFTCRSVWKPLHGFEGLLYKEKEFAVVICGEDEGEIVGKIHRIYTVSTGRSYRTLVTLLAYNHVNFIEGFQLVAESNNYVTVPIVHLSRKLMLYPSELIGYEPNTFIVLDFMRRIFPVSAETVVVPYYPVVNDMVDIQGDGEVWKAKVVGFSLSQQSIRGSFFIHTDNDIWAPDASRVQDIHFNSILGISKGIWLQKYIRWLHIS